MFTLRSFENYLESNKILGESYQVVRREENYEKFSMLFKVFFDKRHVADLDETSDDSTKNCYAILIYSDKNLLLPLFKSIVYYVMTGEGSTYCNISFK